MKAKLHGKLIADSANIREVAGYSYFPREAVQMERLRPSPKTDRDRACPHGVQFYDVSDESGWSERAAWSYEAPQASMKQIDHWVGFWRDVELGS